MIKDTRFGVEIEFTGLSRQKAAETLRKTLGGDTSHTSDNYDTYLVTATDTRVWSIKRDASIETERMDGDERVSAFGTYSVELITPVLTYEKDILVLQEIVRDLRKAGAFTNSSCGIHIHLDGASHNVKTLRNFINAMYSHSSLFTRALAINGRRLRYCKPFSEDFIKALNSKRPESLYNLEELWYKGDTGSRLAHYNNTRYHALNLHSFFHGNGTVELRFFNSTLHAGELRSYIVLALALNSQALTQRSVSSKVSKSDNDKFLMRTYLVRLGLSGDEYKSVRMHLLKHLEGDAAWRNGRTA